MKDDRLGFHASAWAARRSGTAAHANDARGPHEIDYARVIHSSSFRRLQGKTQILAIGDDDFYRTRLTHSLEVAQVAEGVLQELRRRGSERLPDGLLAPSSLIATIALAHDMGHPPFGHGGELALNYCMRAAGGFEGNAQTLRILTRLERFSDGFGADLTRRAVLGTLKYPAPRSSLQNAKIEPRLDDRAETVAVLDRASCAPPKAYYDGEGPIVDWLFEPLSASDREHFAIHVERADKHGKTLNKSFDCSIMDVADDVAYGVHDFEDAIALRLIEADRFRATLPAPACEILLATFQDRPLEGGGQSYDDLVAALFGSEFLRKKAIGRLVHFFLRSVTVERKTDFAEPLLGYRVSLSEEARILLDGLQQLVVDEVIENPRVQHLEFKGQRMVVSVFEALLSDPKRLLPPTVYASLDQAGGDLRILCDHIASMTDGSLLRTYERLFSPRMGSVFDRH